MSIDILMIGEFRTLNLCFESIKKLFSNDVRYFLYTPSNDKPDTDFCYSNNIITHYIELDIQTHNKYPTNLNIGVANPIGIMNQLCLIHKAINYHLENYEQDFIFRLRPDILFEQEKYNFIFKQRTLCVPDFHEFWGYNDRFAYGDRETMCYYANRYLLIDKYLAEGMTFHPETSLKYHFDKSNYSIIKNNIRFKIWRLDGRILNDY